MYRPIILAIPKKKTPMELSSFSASTKTLPSKKVTCDDNTNVLGFAQGNEAPEGADTIVKLPINEKFYKTINPIFNDYHFEEYCTDLLGLKDKLSHKGVAIIPCLLNSQECTNL